MITEMPGYHCYICGKSSDIETFRDHCSVYHPEYGSVSSGIENQFTVAHRSDMTKVQQRHLYQASATGIKCPICQTLFMSQM